jgi:hypothetical protein
MKDVAPFVKLLTAAGQFIAAADYIEGAGLLSLPDDLGAQHPITMTVRHARNRKPVRSEKPCITLVFVGDEPRSDDEQQLNDWETARELTFDLQLDMDLDTEDSELDPTGYAKMSRVLAVAYSSMVETVGLKFLGGLADWIANGSYDPDDKSTSDDGRLVLGISVLYRVRSDDPNVLLAAGENG